MEGGNELILLGITLLLISLVTRHKYSKNCPTGVHELRTCPTETIDLHKPVFMGLSVYELVDITSKICAIIGSISACVGVIIKFYY